MGEISAAFFGRPAASLTVVGITGTNGKTTTTYLLEAVFRGAGWTPGVIGTTGVRIDGRPTPFPRTTPEAPDLHRLLAQMRAEGIEAVAMEVSSHGLDQRRVDGVRFDRAVFTNLSQDHLDYHVSMERYLEAKARLFTPEHERARRRQRRRRSRPPARRVRDPDGHVRGERGRGRPRHRDRDHGPRRRVRLRRGADPLAPAWAVQRGELPRDPRHRPGSRDRGRGHGRGDRLGRSRAGSRGDGGCGPAVPRARRLRAHAGERRERAADRPIVRERPADRRARVRRRSRPGQTCAHGSRGHLERRPHDPDERQPAQRGPERDRRRDRPRRAGRWWRVHDRAGPAVGDPARDGRGGAPATSS